MSTKLLVVTGATGQQGGSVARHLSKNPEWRVRAVTRNPNGEAAKALVSSGIEVVKGDNGDLDSLVKAFEVRSVIPQTICIQTVFLIPQPLLGGLRRLWFDELLGCIALESRQRSVWQDRRTTVRQFGHCSQSDPNFEALHICDVAKRTQVIQGQSSRPSHGLQGRGRRPHNRPHAEIGSKDDILLRRFLSK